MNTESMGTGMSGGPGGPGAKVPIYELAKELGIPPKDLVTTIQNMGIDAKNHMSRLDVEDAAKVRRAVEKKRQENTVAERVNDTVIRRRAKDGTMLHPQAARQHSEPPKPAPAASATTPPAPTVFTRKRVDATAEAQVPASTSRTSPAAQPSARAGQSAEDRSELRSSSKPQGRPEVRADARPEARPEGKTDTRHAKAEARPDVRSAAKTEPRPEGRPEARPEARADAKPEGKPEAKTEAKVEARTEVKAEAKPEAKAEAKPEAKGEAKAEAKPEAKTEVKAEAKAEAKPEAKTEVKAEAKAEVKPEAKTEAKPEVKAEAKAEAKGEAKAEAKPEAKTEVKAEAQAEAKPEAKPEVKAEPEPKAETKGEGKPEAKAEAKAEARQEPRGEARSESRGPRPEGEPRPRQEHKADGKHPPKDGQGHQAAKGSDGKKDNKNQTRPQQQGQQQSKSPQQQQQQQKGGGNVVVRQQGAGKGQQQQQGGKGQQPGKADAPQRQGGSQAPQQPAQAAAPGTEQPKVFVTPQTRKYEGLGPTGRVIDLSTVRPQPVSAPPPPPRQETYSTTSPPRGPRREVSMEQIRQQSRPQHQTRPQQKARLAPGKKAKSTQITTAAEHKRVVKMGESIVINELARQMGAKATDVLKRIWELGKRNVMINSAIDFETAGLVAMEFEWKVESTAFQETALFEEKEDAPEDLEPRAPVVTIMGHVDHGKTSLLDAIRNANVAAGEAGGITQHMGAYKVKTQSGHVVFLDTPGHEAFTEMRARGAQITDIVVLVVAADDGVMPQTLEALNHARDAEVPIIVAVNKIDKPQARPEQIRQQLSGHGLTPEEWGGQTIYRDVSARSKIGIEDLLEMLALQAEVLELKANPKKQAKGAVVEARMDAKRGPVATILVQEGTLHIGDTVVVGEEMGKVRAMTDDRGQTQQQAGPSTPVELLGLSGVPRAGESLNVVTDERAAKELVEFRRNRRVEKERAKAGGPVSLANLMDAMKAGLKELKVILKADVQGSVEALAGALVKLSTQQVKVTIIQSGVGGITESDVNLAKAGNAVIIGFHVRPAGKASSLAEQEGVDIKLYDVIYDALDDVKKAMAGLLAPVKREKSIGRAEVRKIINIPKLGVICGCAVLDGLIRRSAHVRLIRDSVQIYQGRLGSLRRFKDDVREVQSGYECGLSIDGYQDIKEGDVIEAYEIEEIAATLD